MTTDQDTIARREAEAAFEALWQQLLESDDRTSPEEYPDHALITCEEAREFFDAGSRHQSDRERIEAERRVLEAARAYAATKPTDPARLLRDRERSLLTRASALAAETQEQGE